MTDVEFQKLIIERSIASSELTDVSQVLVWVEHQRVTAQNRFTELDERYRAEKDARKDTL